MTLTMHDLFAGAGGSSTGAINVPGVTIRLAMNHWQLAVTVHNENHPDADHLCADISQYDPRRIPTADLLWASPECTNHSQAQVDDCLFRMLEPHEIAAGMAFPGDYRWQGTRRERVRMAGNAVTPPAARGLVGAVVGALEGS